MLGKILSTAVKAVTVPVDVYERTGDWLCGGNGTKAEQLRGQAQGENSLSRIRDIVTDTLEDLDD